MCSDKEVLTEEEYHDWKTLDRGNEKPEQSFSEPYFQQCGNFYDEVVNVRNG